MALTVLRNALVTSGYEVVSATNGREALAVLRDGACRLVISDLEMPEMDGLDLCRAIRADGNRRLCVRNVAHEP